MSLTKKEALQYLERRHTEETARLNDFRRALASPPTSAFQTFAWDLDRGVRAAALLDAIHVVRTAVTAGCGLEGARIEVVKRSKYPKQTTSTFMNASEIAMTAALAELVDDIVSITGQA